jgi:nitrite reductase/ring-hydroxylating ferredoxin subunit
VTRVAGVVQAFENKCPHLNLALTRGKIANGAITCPWHGSRFDICSGRNLDWVNSFIGIPMPGWTRGMIAMGKKPAGLTVFAASERDGAVFADIP